MSSQKEPQIGIHLVFGRKEEKEGGRKGSREGGNKQETLLMAWEIFLFNSYSSRGYSDTKLERASSKPSSFFELISGYATCEVSKLFVYISHMRERHSRILFYNIKMPQG